MTWDGKFYSMSVDPEGSPELFTELSSLAPRARTERLRALALIGLMTLRGGVVASDGLPEPTPQQGGEDKKENVRKALGAKLMGGL